MSESYVEYCVYLSGDQGVYADEWLGLPKYSRPTRDLEAAEAEAARWNVAPHRYARVLSREVRVGEWGESESHAHASVTKALR